MDQEIRNLLSACVPSLATTIEVEVAKPIADFKHDSYPRLAAIDEQIPGVGMHYVIWKGSTPLFPFEPRFDGIVRPLSYVPYLLASNVHPMTASRMITQDIGGHIQECVAEFCKISGLKGYPPLGRWIKDNQSALGQPLSGNILSYLSLSWNKGKHKWHTGSPDSVIPVENTLGCYFIARSLGANILEKCGQLHVVVQALQTARQRGHVYNRPELI